MSCDGYYPYHNAGGYPPTQPYGYGDGSAPNAQWNQGQQQHPNTSAYTGGQPYPPEYIQQQQQYYYANSAALAGALQPPPRPQTAAGYPQSSSAAAAAGYSHSAAGYPPPQTHAMISLDTADPQDVAIIGQKTRSLSNAPKRCTECGTRDTPLWRRHPQTDKPVCNACGLWFEKYGNSKPSPRSRGAWVAFAFGYVGMCLVVGFRLGPGLRALWDDGCECVAAQ
ncbi:Protein containing GATA family zinc finger motifs [Mycena kentingensis (nom. inval.)]|nr:Protein containing GATA family zinc finger motifs [Mycena kentingensis (nom. inval.)]